MVPALSTASCCAVCGQEVAAGTGCANHWCRREDRAFSCVFAAGSYDGRLRAAILDYKYRRACWRAEGFARLLAALLDRHATWFEEFGVIAGVPAFRGPGARRDWDPVGAVVHQLGAMQAGAWEVLPGVLRKRVETVPMSGRTREERERIGRCALRGALEVADPAPIGGARVLVVDDVFAEGSTLQEVSRALVAAGALEVAGLVLARSRWRAAGGPPASPPGRPR